MLCTSRQILSPMRFTATNEYHSEPHDPSECCLEGKQSSLLLATGFQVRQQNTRDDYHSERSRQENETRLCGDRNARHADQMSDGLVQVKLSFVREVESISSGV